MSPRRLAPLARACSFLAALTLVACSGDQRSGPLAPAEAARSTGSVTLPLKGTVVASHTAVYPPNTGTALVHEEGTGTATHLGRYTWVADITLTLAMGTGTAQSTFTAANGDVITAAVTLAGTPAGAGYVNTRESATITGGTGRFAGATGSYVQERLLNVVTGASTGSFDGTITVVH
jgi:hypothetical protein